MAYIDRIRHVTDGEPATANVVSRSTSELEANVDWLRQIMESAVLGQALFAKDQPVDPDLVVGQPVFWDTGTSRYEAAFAGFTVLDNELVPEASAVVAGIIHTKTAAARADIATFGLHNIAMGLPAGVYYLSGQTEGALTSVPAAYAIPVCVVLDAQHALVGPVWRHPGMDHRHWSFSLTCAPAGDHVVPTLGDPHVISGADPQLSGWLPANHAVFSGLAPAGAEFGYNIALHTDLGTVWPPIPLAACKVTWDKGRDLVGGTDVPLGASGLVQITEDGIWWMSDAYEDVPWPNLAFTNGSATESPPPGDRDEEMRLVLDFGRVNLAINDGIVTSLQSLSAFLHVLDCNGAVAQTGNLFLDLDLSFLSGDDDETGYLAYKSFDPATLTFGRGPVVEGLLEGPYTSLSSVTTRLLDPDDPQSDTVYQGLVTVTADIDPSGREIAWEVVRSDEMKQRYDGSVMFLAFPSAYASSLRAKAYVPAAGVAADTDVKLRLVILVTGPMTALPTLQVSYRLIPAASAVTVLPTGDTALVDIVLPAVVDAGKHYFTVESEEFTVQPGDTLFLSLTRDGTADGYQGEVGILRSTVVVA